MNSGCGRLAERQLQISDGLDLWVYKRGVFQEVVNPTRDKLFSRLESFLNLLYAPGGLIFLKKDICKAFCKSNVLIILSYFDSTGLQKGS